LNLAQILAFLNFRFGPPCRHRQGQQRAATYQLPKGQMTEKAKTVKRPKILSTEKGKKA
jgi:hypothetical protein